MCMEMSGNCETITIIQPELAQHNTWCTVPLSVGMCHTTNFNSVSIEHTDRSASSTSSRDLTSEQNNSAPKASSADFNGAIVRALWPRHGIVKASVLSDTSPKLYFSIRFDSYCMFIRGVIFLWYLIYCRILPIGLCFYASLYFSWLCN